MEVSSFVNSEILERFTDVFFAIDRDSCITYINKTGAQLFSKDQDELMGKHIFQQFPEALGEMCVWKYKEALDRQVPVEFDHYYGKPLNNWYHTQIYPSESGLSIFLKDITPKLVQKRINDEYYKSLFEQNPNGVFSLDLAGTITSVNPSLEKITGFPLEQFIEKKYDEVDIVQSSDIGMLQEYFIMAKNSSSQTFEIILKHKDGYSIDCVLTFFPINVMNRIVGIFGLLQDTTEIKQMEMHLRKSQQRYKSLKYHHPDGICSFDINGHLIGANPAFEKLSGYTYTELKQMDLDNILNKNDYKKLNQKILGIFKQDWDVNSLELALHTKSENIIYTVTTLIPFYIEDKLEGFYLIFKDITKNKQTEELLIRSEKLSAMGQLAASIVHEIRNPLTSLMGFLQLMKANPSVNQEYYHIMYDEMMRINSITNELLFLAKPQTTNIREEDIEGCLTDVTTLMNSQANLNNIEIRLQIDENLPKIQGDASQLKQVFINILKNGIESMEDKKSGIIHVSAYQSDVNRIHVSFKDQGKGLSEEQIKHIGEPFYTTKKQGTGLGMLMTKNIIKNHNGELKIDSEVGIGTTIHVSLPVSNPSFAS